MKILIQAWLGWHLLLAAIALLRATPSRWWIDAGAMRPRVRFMSRIWVGVVPADMWVGWYWSEERRRLFIVLCPPLVLRLDLQRRERDAWLPNLLRGIEETKRARGLADWQIADDLVNVVGRDFALGTREEAIVDEAAVRLRSASREGGPS